jgi:hypothetical protein
MPITPPSGIHDDAAVLTRPHKEGTTSGSVTTGASIAAGSVAGGSVTGGGASVASVAGGVVSKVEFAVLDGAGSGRRASSRRDRDRGWVQRGVSLSDQDPDGVCHREPGEAEPVGDATGAHESEHIGG